MDGMDYKHILVETKGSGAYVTVNRPKQMNALNPDTLRELEDAFIYLGHRAEIRAIVVTGAGDKAFVAGADIAEMVDMEPPEALEFSRLGHKVLRLIEETPKPAIAAVNGYALGGGCELAMACDIIVAASTAKFGQPEVNLGVTPGFGGTQRLTRRVGLGAARLLSYTGDAVTAEEALRIGLADIVVAPEELEPRCAELVEKMAQKGPLALATAKDVILRGADLDLANANMFEANAFSWLFSTEDQKEGMKAFLDRRKPEFKGK